ncbi:MAG: hypothetical protein FWG64_08465 [Firmicutes bacterium]|nr:hypothetical protein [Bacillota bacterium]
MKNIPVEKDGKVWTGIVSSQYLDQWIVMTDVEWAEDGHNRKIGYVHSVYDDADEARTVRDKLEESTKKRVSLIQGHDSRMSIGGYFCERTDSN